MSIKTKIATLALTALAVTGSIAATSTPAAANGFHHHHHWGWGVGAGLVGAAVVGSAIAASNDSYSYGGGYRYCRWVPQFNVYGQYVGRVRACGY
ncbi:MULTISPECIES: hypothetical protein [unclassified Bradyrhizobium]|uniref:hypothetical protein n=1 Tax=unclassified Bradyrhizobium TaxID=2631580 RepID=UPI0028E6F4C0|nr:MULTISPECIES: hypothetical protein [unclassified Bradyrhizobium]